ncbi:glycosyl transferase, partial [Gluconobacter sphaericus]|nr:glycosyl transferase [Gluconobacter sphaericus]
MTVWLAMILTEEQDLSAARIECSPRVHAQIHHALRAMLEAHLPDKDIRIVSQTSQNDKTALPLLCQITEDAPQSPSSFPVLQFGPNHPAGSVTLAPENALTNAGNSPFLRTLMSENAEPLGLRRNIRLLLNNSRKIRLLMSQAQAIQQASLEKTQTIQELRVSLRMLSAKNASLPPEPPLPEQTEPPAPPAVVSLPPEDPVPNSLPIPPLWLRAARRLKR